MNVVYVQYVCTYICMHVQYVCTYICMHAQYAYVDTCTHLLCLLYGLNIIGEVKDVLSHDGKTSLHE